LQQVSAAFLFFANPYSQYEARGKHIQPFETQKQASDGDLGVIITVVLKDGFLDDQS